MIIFAALCAAASVALGAIYMFAAGAPRSYIVISVAALAVGLIAASLIRRVPLRDRRLTAAATIAIGVALFATALFGIHLEGASRWISIAGISLQPSLILLPFAIVHFAMAHGWSSSIGLVFASIGLAMQPDRAMSGTLAAGLAALWLLRREAAVSVALAAAVAGFVTTLLRSDVVAPVLFVEQVVQSSFAFHPLTGVAIVVGLMTLILPAAAGVVARRQDAAVFVVFGATWAAVIAFAIVGNYPTPLVGYGSSAILGYCFSAAIPIGTLSRE